jgi:hypothetical protein
MDEELFEVVVEAALPLQALIAMIVGGLVPSLPESWLVARSQFTTLNLSDSTTSPVDHCKRTSAFPLVDLEEHRKKIAEWRQECASGR